MKLECLVSFEGFLDGCPRRAKSAIDAVALCFCSFQHSLTSQSVLIAEGAGFCLRSCFTCRTCFEISTDCWVTGYSFKGSGGDFR